MKVVNKLLIILIGLIIITFLVFKLFEKDKIIEGGPFPGPLDVPEFTMQTTELGLNTGEIATERADDIAGKIIDSTTLVQESTERAVYAGQESVRDTTMAAVEEATDNIRAGIDESTKLGLLFQNVREGLKLAWEIKYLTMFAGISIILGGYIWNVGVWSMNMISCLFVMFGNFSSCFFYYFLDIIGYVLYLPFAFMFYLFRSSIEIYYPDCKRKDYPPIYNVEKEIWNLIYDIDCKIYDATGFHVFHYSEEIMKRCYSCSPGPFPPFPNLFSPQGWNKAIKEYNIFTTITGIKF